MANIVEFWKREGFYYVSRIYVNDQWSRGTITKKLDFVSYHLIRLIHGEKGLREMACKYDPMGDQ